MFVIYSIFVPLTRKIGSLKTSRKVSREGKVEKKECPVLAEVYPEGNISEAL